MLLFDCRASTSHVLLYNCHIEKKSKKAWHRAWLPPLLVSFALVASQKGKTIPNKFSSFSKAGLNSIVFSNSSSLHRNQIALGKSLQLCPIYSHFAEWHQSPDVDLNSHHRNTAPFDHGTRARKSLHSGTGEQPKNSGDGIKSPQHPECLT